MRMRHTVNCGLSRSTILFPTLSHKRYDFRRKVIERKMCVLIFSTNFVWNIFHYKKNSARYCHIIIQSAVVILHDKPPLMTCYDTVYSDYITWRATTDPTLRSSVQCLYYMTSHHWPHVTIQCAVLTVHDEPPLTPCYDPVYSAYITWLATTDPMLRSSVQCLQYMTSHHWPHVTIQCAV